MSYRRLLQSFREVPFVHAAHRGLRPPCTALTLSTRGKAQCGGCHPSACGASARSVSHPLNSSRRLCIASSSELHEAGGVDESLESLSVPETVPPPLDETAVDEEIVPPLMGPVIEPSGMTGPPETVRDLIRCRPADLEELTLAHDATVKDLINHLLQYRVGAVLVVEAGTVVGIVTERDVIKTLALQDRSPEQALATPLSQIMTKERKILHATPDMTVLQLAVKLYERKIRALPVFEDGVVRGMMGLRQVIWAFCFGSFGGKDSAVRNTITKRQPKVLLPSMVVPTKMSLTLASGAASVPHYRKTLGEDAFFVVSNLPWNLKHLHYFGVFDGVGSWSEMGVDAGLFSRTLSKECENSLMASVAFPTVAPPGTAAVLDVGLRETIKKEIVGSCTALIGTLDAAHGQLTIANVGDSGLLVLRRSTSSQLGSLAHKDAIHRQWHIVFRSTQQLHDFNQPYQVGYSPGDEDTFESAADANIMRFPVEEQDVIVVATDGVFDNLYESEILRIATGWFESIEAEGRLPTHSDAAHCADLIVQSAKEASMDKTRDSPFANLAKENDIMWGGGMPDDATAIVSVVLAEPTDLSEEDVVVSSSSPP